MMKQKHFIDSHKGLTGVFILGLMAVFHQWENPTAWVYLALHGAYGLLWVLKSRIFPDKSWEQPVSLVVGVVKFWGGLTLYWIAPFLLTLRDVHAPGWYQGMCIALYAVGVFIHFSSDMQKYTQLRLAPEKLITDGMFARVRNPNYFGELLIYLSFGLLAMHWAPILVLFLFITAYWLPMMRRKDHSLARFPEFSAYQQRTKLFIPFLF
jgi:steroid 5-alpha reductase family enzyme